MNTWLSYGARRHHGAGDDVVGLHERGRHDDQVGAGEGLQADGLGELDVIADEEPEAQAVDLGAGEPGRAGTWRGRGRRRDGVCGG